MEHTDDTARGDWIRERLSDRSTIGGVIPTGFEAYARIFHPVDVQWITWRDGVVHCESGETVTWAEAADRLGTVAHPLMQWGAVARNATAPLPGIDGWQWGEPRDGSLADDQLATAASVLARHTATPQRCIAGLWDGYGWMSGSPGGSVAILTAATDPEELERIRAEANRPIPSPFSAAVLSAPRLELPGRSYLLFEADVAEFTDTGWSAESRWQNSPNLLWPNDRAWFLAYEIDFDSTLVSGSRELVDELLRTEGLEVAELSADASLQWDADEINGTPRQP